VAPAWRFRGRREKNTEQKITAGVKKGIKLEETIKVRK